MQFLVENEYTTQRSHVGVQEFVAPEGTCYMPYWVRCRHWLWRKAPLARAGHSLARPLPS